MSPRTFREGTERPTREEAKEIEGVHYAMARSVCAWMDEKEMLWPFYRAWRDGVLGDETGEKAFASVLGGTPREKNGEWVAWAR